jgi:hypothetical protein
MFFFSAHRLATQATVDDDYIRKKENIMKLNASGNPFNQAEFDAAVEALEQAKAALKENPCAETRIAKSEARNAASALAPKQKRKGFACRAGRRQAAENRARWGHRS